MSNFTWCHLLLLGSVYRQTSLILQIQLLFLPSTVSNLLGATWDPNSHPNWHWVAFQPNVIPSFNKPFIFLIQFARLFARPTFKKIHNFVFGNLSHLLGGWECLKTISHGFKRSEDKPRAKLLALRTQVLYSPVLYHILYIIYSPAS